MVLGSTVLLAGVLAVAMTVSLGGWAHEPASLGLEGYAAATVGGRGGHVAKVTSLADSGPGTLRWALEDLDEPRIVEFDVSGLIALEDEIKVNGRVTVSGETSPEGVTISGGRLKIIGNDVIVRGLRIRPGDGPGAPAVARDAISIGQPGTVVERVVIVGNSLTWSMDEVLAIWGDARDITIADNIIAESLDAAAHEKGDHGMGMLIGGGGVSRVTIVRNLLAHNQHRNPTVKDGSINVEFINNLVYNWGQNGLQADRSSVHILGNVFLAGPDSRPQRPAIRLAGKDDLPSQYYLNDNVGSLSAGARVSKEPVFVGSGVRPLPAKEVVDLVLADAGARHPELDEIDARIIASARSGGGQIIDTPAEVGGYLASPRDHDDGKFVPASAAMSVGEGPSP